MGGGSRTFRATPLSEGVVPPTSLPWRPAGPKYPGPPSPEAHVRTPPTDCPAVPPDGDPRGSGGPAPPVVRPAGGSAAGPVPAAGPFRIGEPGRLHGRLSLAPPPRDRDGDLHAGGAGSPRRHPRPRGGDRPGRPPVDARGQRHHPSGDARTGGGTAGRLPALGQPAGPGEDVDAPLPGDHLPGDPRGRAHGRGPGPRRRRPVRRGRRSGPGDRRGSDLRRPGAAPVVDPPATDRPRLYGGRPCGRRGGPVRA